MKVLKCADVGFQCDGVIRAPTEEEVLQQAAAHAKQVHQLDVTPEIAEKVKAASAVDTMVSIRGFVEDDKLYGYMQMIGAPGNQVSWTPFSGKRAMLTSPPAVMPRSAPTP